jgi:hypothetical protein
MRPIRVVLGVLSKLGIVGPNLAAGTDIVLYRKHPLKQGHKKNRRGAYPKVFDHVGLLFNEPPSKAELLFI